MDLMDMTKNFRWPLDLQRQNLTPGDGVSQVAWRKGWWVVEVTIKTLAIYETWVVVSNIFCFHPSLGKIPNLTNIFQRG